MTSAPKRSSVRAADGAPQIALDDLLGALGQAAFRWDLVSDTLTWSGDLAAIFPGVAPTALGDGAALAALIERSPDVRTEAVAAAGQYGGSGTYRIDYGVRADASSPVVRIEESGCVARDAEGRPQIVTGLICVDTERHARDEQLLKLAQNDPLTEELNRTHLIAGLAEAIAEAMRFRTSFAFMLVGIDHLSRVNDSFGFDIADQVIVEVARRIRMRLRGGDLLGRFSGNKFGLVLKNCTVDDAAVAAERFLSGIRDEIVPTRSGPVSVTASIGAISLPRHAQTADDAINRAQESLDIAKCHRHGSFSIWRPDATREAQRRVNIRVTDEIVAALNDRRIVTAFEPVVDARTRQPVFYECLVRMTKNDGATLRAPDVVPIAEKLGLIRLVDNRVLDLVAAELEASPQVQLSLNISPDTTSDPDWLANIEAMMRARPGVAERLIVEITETVAIHDIDAVGGFVRRLKGFGSRIAIDDFGAGYTSFRNLRKLGVDIVKIDGDFVQNLATSADDRAFVQTLIDLACRLGIKTVAEWVQDEASAAMLRDWGCDFIQGQLIGLASVDRPWATEVGQAAIG